jgi:transposase-like protein
METQFKNLIECTKHFSDENVCWDYLETFRWGGVVICPFCKSRKLYKFQNSRTYKCADCKKKFNAKIGTIFENTKVPLSKWFVAIYIITSHKKGISSLQLGKDISVTQKTAWFILHRIREMLNVKAPYLLDGMVEVDESYFGGKSINKHKSVRTKGTGYANKTMVFGVAQRKGVVYNEVVKNVSSETLKPMIRNTVNKNAVVVSDGFGSYTGLDKEFKQHEVINHAEDEWLRGEFHTNTIEGYWSLLKRGIYGIYHSVSPKHLHRYCNEFEFRYNTRKSNESDRFDFSLIFCDKRLKYNDLIGKEVI